jgi:peptidoglycan/xylan/chitin deacetylase (PgdA/CDA1 family)
VAVTFDDGLSNVIENALPELENRAIPSTHFIVAGVLGQYPTWPTFAADPDSIAQPIMSADQLVALSPLVTIGSHTLTHALLPETKEPNARHELAESRRILESLLGRSVTLLSFPYGAFTADVLKWCADVGYRRVFTTQPVLAFRETDEFMTGRVPASPTDWQFEFRLKVLGAYRWLPYGFALKQHLRCFIQTRRS